MNSQGPWRRWQGRPRNHRIVRRIMQLRELYRTLLLLLDNNTRFPGWSRSLGWCWGQIRAYPWYSLGTFIVNSKICEYFSGILLYIIMYCNNEFLKSTHLYFWNEAVVFSGTAEYLLIYLRRGQFGRQHAWMQAAVRERSSKWCWNTMLGINVSMMRYKTGKPIPIKGPWTIISLYYCTPTYR